MQPNITITLYFLHSVKPGPASQSYGLQVAKLAGVPKNVIDQAKKKLNELESHVVIEDIKNNKQTNQQDLFAQQNKNPILEKLKEIDPNTLTPKEALDLVYELLQQFNSTIS